MALSKQEMLLVMLMEECDELSQRASKALRFGLNEVQDGQELTNLERIIYEFNDLMAITQTLATESIVRYDMICLKKDKIKKYLAYSTECGTLTEQQ